MLLLKKKVSLDDVDDIEPYLLLGLPAATFLEAVLRSRGQEGLVMATGLTVTEATVPSQVLALYNGLGKCKIGCENLSAEDAAYLRYAVLFQMKEQPATASSGGGGSGVACVAGAADEASKPGGAGLTPPDLVRLAEERKEQLNRAVVGPLASVVTEVSQLPFYKSNYLDVLESASKKHRGRVAARGEHEPVYGTEVEEMRASR